MFQLFLLALYPSFLPFLYPSFLLSFLPFFLPSFLYLFFVVIEYTLGDPVYPDHICKFIPPESLKSVQSELEASPISMVELFLGCARGIPRVCFLGSWGKDLFWCHRHRQQQLQRHFVGSKGIICF